MGVVTGVHGVDGELKVRPLTDDPSQFETLKECYFGDEEKPRRIRSARFHAGSVLLKLAGIATREAADAFRGYQILARTSQLNPLAEEEYFLYQIIGLDAFDEDGARVGRVVDLIETGSADVFVIDPGEGAQQILLANLPEVILSIEPAAGRLTVRLPAYYE